MSTATAQPTRLRESFARLARSYLHAVETRDVDGLVELGTQLNNDVIAVVAASDAKEIARLASRVSRLRRNAAQLDANLDGALTPLSVMLNTLEIRHAAALAAEESANRKAEARTLRERVFQLIADGVGQPTPIASRLEVDPVQVSRTIRLLVEEGFVEPVSPPVEHASDKRIRWYATTSKDAGAPEITIADRHDGIEVLVQGELEVLAVLRGNEELSVVDRRGRSAGGAARRRLAAALRALPL